MADKISAEDFGKMKVADLKKALKERGLPLTGTKSELLERLKSAVQSEEEQYIEDFPFFDDKFLECEAATDTTAALEDSILDDSVDLSVPKPAPKPAVVDKEAEPVVKKITSPQKTDDEAESKPKLVSTQLSAEERMKQRAERFGVVNEDLKKQIRAERFGTSSPSSKLSTAGAGADTDALKKRAERFGQVLSPALSKVDEAEKIRKRKERFGDVTSATNNGPNKPKLVKITMSSAEEEQKKKRAERFGMS
ncbi:SAP domain-containing ribonucleoprotein-like isoform X1 [Ruditapes philippinarum]|uniref:SAP domain-containing ribonucleoprotein-like isoform X1 n=1 Tax=Ruditapes philippinarum TaxID=129788 RepID=UPI00295ABFC1|nr:SAP domain-containing ribonucleoprotein-like isoform X1 [Ruditapes philippinarum]